MTFKEKFNIPDNATHEEKYRIIINGLGYENVKTFLPVDKETIVDALKKDEHLNSIDINIWDRASGFRMVQSPTRRMEPAFTETGLTSLCCQKGITSYSPAELVCILKQCARRYAKE